MCPVTWREKGADGAGDLLHQCDMIESHDEKAREVGVAGVHQCRCRASHTTRIRRA